MLPGSVVTLCDLDGERAYGQGLTAVMLWCCMCFKPATHALYAHNTACLHDESRLETILEALACQLN